MQPGSVSHRAATPPKKKKGATTKGKSTARSSSPAKSSRPKSSRPKPAKHKPAGPLRDITVPSDVETTDAAVQVQRPWTSSSWAPWVRSAAARSCDPQSLELPRCNYFEPHIWVGEPEAAAGELEMENEALRAELEALRSALGDDLALKGEPQTADVACEAILPWRSHAIDPSRASARSTPLPVAIRPVAITTTGVGEEEDSASDATTVRVHTPDLSVCM